MKFLRNLSAAILGTMIGLGLIFLLSFIILAVIGSSAMADKSGENGEGLKPNTVLQINLNKRPYEYEGTSSEKILLLRFLMREIMVWIK